MIDWEAANILCPYCKNRNVFRMKNVHVDKKFADRVASYKCFNCMTYFSENARKELEAMQNGQEA